MKPFFKPEDFFHEDVQYRGLSNIEAAARADKILEGRGKIVYGNSLDENDPIMERWLDSQKWYHDKKAILVNIEIIEPKECDHEANWWRDGLDIKYENCCLKCRQKIAPVGWKVIT